MDFNSCKLTVYGLVFLIFLILLPDGASAQSKPREKPFKILGINIDTLLQSPIKEIDTTFITPYYNFLHIHPIGEDRNYSLYVSDKKSAIAYKPNVPFSIGAGLSYKWLNLALMFKLPFTDKALERKGKTNQVGFGLSYTGRKLLISTYYQSAKGMYLSNPEEFDLDWFSKNNSYPIREDLLVRTLFTQTYYIFNYKKFSNRAAYSFQERQKKSAGSFLLGGSFNFFQLRSDSSLAFFPGNEAFNDKRSVNFNSYGFSVNPGYAHTLVFKKIFFASVFLRPGIAFKMNKAFDLTETKGPYKFQLGWEGNISATLGINNDNYYGGISYSLLLFSDKLKDTGIYNSYTYLKILIGRRFNFKPKGVLRKVPGFNNKP